MLGRGAKEGVMIRTPLLLLVFEWKDELKQWKKSKKRLKRAVKKAHRKVEKKLGEIEQRGPQPGETGEQFGNRLLDKQERLRKKIFKQRRERLAGLRSVETAHFADYVEADRLRRKTLNRPRVRKMRPVRRRG
jgi:hypothetical protein